MTNDGYRDIYTAAYDPASSGLPVCLDGMLIDGPVDYLAVAYYHSDTLNKNSIIWRCDYSILAAEMSE